MILLDTVLIGLQVVQVTAGYFIYQYFNDKLKKFQTALDGYANREDVKLKFGRELLQKRLAERAANTTPVAAVYHENH